MIIPINYATLTLLFSIVPHFRHNNEFLANLKEALVDLKVSRKDTREQEIIKCIETTTKYIQDGISLDAEGLIRISSTDETVGSDVYAKYLQATDENKKFIASLVDFLSVNKVALKKMDNIISKLTFLQSSPTNTVMNEYQDIINDFKSVAIDITTRTTKANNKTVKFSRSPKGLDNIITQLRYEDSNALSSGIPALDEFIGKLKPKKLYATIALSGGFKSGFLENITLGVAKSNPNVDKIPGKENCVLHITLENDTLQVFKRFVDWHMDEKMFSRKLIDMSDAEVTGIAHKYIAPQSDNEMAIVVREFHRYDIGPDDLDAIVNELANEGMRVMLIVLDYADLLAVPINRNDTDDKTKTDLVKKFENLKLAAQRLNVPIVTAGQFNREGERVAQEVIGRRVYPSPLMGGQLNASHVAGGFGIKFHVEALLIQFRGRYNNVTMLHMLLDKDRDNNKEITEMNTNNGHKGNLRFFKFTKNGFRISPAPEDVYDDIRDVIPDDPNSILGKLNEFDMMQIPPEMQAKLDADLEEARKLALGDMLLQEQLKK